MKLALNTVAVLFVLFVFVVSWQIASIPSAGKINECLTTRMHKVKLCEKSASYTQLNSISPYLKSLVIIAEDAGFYGHQGFDWAELQNSFFSNLRGGKIARGGSTITQQLAKNVFLNFDRTYTRKFKEAILAAQIEKILNKNKILEKYLNVIEFGPDIFGVTRAAQHYFQKKPSDLNVLESAFLVYVIPNPKIHSRTFKNKTLTPYARFRILDLLFKLYKTHHLSAEDYLLAKENVDAFPWQNLNINEIPAELTLQPTPPEGEDTPQIEPPLIVEPSEDEASADSVDAPVDYVESVDSIENTDSESPVSEMPEEKTFDD